MTAMFAAIAEKRCSAIAATMIAEIENVLSQRSLSLRSLESGFHMIAAIAELFISQRLQRSQH